MVSASSIDVYKRQPLMMSIYEATGVFQNVFVFGFIVDIVIIALVILAKKSSRTLRWLSD